MKNEDEHQASFFFFFFLKMITITDDRIQAAGQIQFLGCSLLLLLLSFFCLFVSLVIVLLTD